MRTVTYHLGSDANNEIHIAADDPGAGGASHEYIIRPKCGYNEPTPDDYGTVSFQNGAIKEFGRNGLTDESLIAIVVDRLRCFQSGPFSCRENALALTKLEEAMHWMNARTKDRVSRGVEGVSKA